MHTWSDTDTERQTPRAPSYDALAAESERRTVRKDLFVETAIAITSLYAILPLSKETKFFYNETIERFVEIGSRIDPSVTGSGMVCSLLGLATMASGYICYKGCEAMLSTREKLDNLNQKVAQREPLKLVK